MVEIDDWDLIYLTALLNTPIEALGEGDLLQPPSHAPLRSEGPVAIVAKPNGPIA